MNNALFKSGDFLAEKSLAGTTSEMLKTDAQQFLALFNHI